MLRIMLMMIIIILIMIVTTIRIENHQLEKIIM